LRSRPPAQVLDLEFEALHQLGGEREDPPIRSEPRSWGMSSKRTSSYSGPRCCRASTPSASRSRAGPPKWTTTGFSSPRLVEGELDLRFVEPLRLEVLGRLIVGRLQVRELHNQLGHRMVVQPLAVRRTSSYQPRLGAFLEALHLPDFSYSITGGLSFPWRDQVLVLQLDAGHLMGA